jgi:hypothetical protein
LSWRFHFYKSDLFRSYRPGENFFGRTRPFRPGYHIAGLQPVAAKRQHTQGYASDGANQVLELAGEWPMIGTVGTNQFQNIFSFTWG